MRRKDAVFRASERMIGLWQTKKRKRASRSTNCSKRPAGAFLMTRAAVDALGEFDTVHNGFVDFLLLDDKSFPLVVLEAKANNKDPLVGKEQARAYVSAQNCRFVILSNNRVWGEVA